MGEQKPLASAPRRAATHACGAVDDAAARAKQRILAEIRAVPAGSVASYGAIAHRAGLPGRARLAARILSENDDSTLPWHRVLRADGRIALPEGSAGWREQCARLRAEGVTVRDGRVAMPPASSDIDTLLWGPPPAQKKPIGRTRR